MPEMTNAGRTIFFTDTGAAPGAPVVAVHSSGFSSRQWNKLGQLLAPRHRFLAPDLIGVGGSSALQPGAGFEFSEDADAVAALLATLPEPAHLVGHSYGGLVALHAALRAPARVRSLAIFEAVPFWLLSTTDDAARFAEEMKQNRFEEGEGEDAWQRRFVDWWQGPGAWDALQPQARAAFLVPGRKTFLEVNSLMRDRTPASAYAALTMPALIMRSERSPWAARRANELLAQALPKGTLVDFAGVGHLAPVTHAAQVNARIAEHIEQS